MALSDKQRVLEVAFLSVQVRGDQETLLEAQFDLYKSFKDKVNSLSANELRLQPCGRDKKGVSYWCQLDECANLRVYSDDQDEETWTLVAR
ncbi:Remodeling and spacing factor 1 [Portunus trituberculatus]|uniref:Remodeling and spacing factor 1 n=1 Tax=Portunus trituberculatus TaxID=210409 RepID=A0A5B7HC99_PORTR|nr:Remodeling and spacing factor 1 [Portunus trituberculatus]